MKLNDVTNIFTYVGLQSSYIYYVIFIEYYLLFLQKYDIAFWQIGGIMICWNYLYTT